jgi:hypothetical protein
LQKILQSSNENKTRKKREVKNKQKKQSLGKDKDRKLENKQEETHDMEVSPNTEHDHYSEDIIITNDSQPILAPLYGQQPLAKSNMRLSFSNLGDETVIGGFNMDQPKSG